mmetsp:Transcript_13436/g.11475  ORF Transcript_13436/g.11475 Transcript_13436/m.11475 type:complete len:101 (-) Transcript_13436:34-336(-)
MGITSPAFLILLVFTILLHMYNNHIDGEIDEMMKKQRILRIKREKLEREGKVDMSYFQPATTEEEDTIEDTNDNDDDQHHHHELSNTTQATLPTTDTTQS